MRYGFNLLLWAADLGAAGNASTTRTLSSLKLMGYDTVEVPLFGPGEHETSAQYIARCTSWGAILDDLELDRTAVTCRTEDDNPISPDKTVRAHGVTNNKLAVVAAAAIGATHLVGPFHSALGHFTGQGPTQDEINWGVESMQKVAKHAKNHDVTLALEALNRFECYFLNCMEQLAYFLQLVNHPNCRGMYDTFHANIEEPSIHRAVEAIAPYLVHVHISENNRATPGDGGVNWNATALALQAIGYDGLLVVEAFGLALPEIAAATKIWRRMYESEEQLARDALAFMRQKFPGTPAV